MSDTTKPVTEVADGESGSATPRRGRSGVWVPLAIFTVVAALFGAALVTGDPSRLPSMLIGQPAPKVALSAVEGMTRADGKAMPTFKVAGLPEGQPAIVNFWASWCGPCRVEHPQLMALAALGIYVAGVNYKDAAANARRFVDTLGNPYQSVGADPGGNAAIEWGVYGMPETFILDRQGRIAHRHVGPVEPQDLTSGPFAETLRRVRASSGG